MSSLLPGYEYDIFISYRHNDNRSGWVTEFVNALQEELAATIKEPLSIYFDKNPHDGLLETHNIDKSLEGKLKCLIFIPIISQTYCDPKSFAWQHEFCAFNKLAQADQLGRDIKLSNGNVASRILPIKIHDLDEDDKGVIEREIAGVLRSIEFIFKSPGVNRPLRSEEDHPQDNLNKTYYRDQVNKVANSIKEILSSLKKPVTFVHSSPANQVSTSKKPKNKKWRVITTAIILLLAAAGYFLFSKLNQTTESVVLEKSIAVLPFDNLSGDPEQQYFSDGISEEILNVLTQLPGLKVAGRTSSFSFRDKQMSIQEIGESLRVGTVLEGSIRKTGNRIRITAQLINVADGFHIFSEQYDRDMTDIFAIQDEIAKLVAGKLRLTLLNSSTGTSVKNAPKNLEAHNLYLEGVHLLWNRPDLRALSKEKMSQAIALDSTFAQAYAFLARMIMEEAFMGNADPIACREKALPLLKKALALNDQDFYTNIFMANYNWWYAWNFKEAESYLIKAADLNPSSIGIYPVYGNFYYAIGDYEKSARYSDICLNDNPTSPLSYQCSRAYVETGQLDRANEVSNKALELFGPTEYALYFATLNANNMGNYQRTVDLLEPRPESVINNSHHMSVLAIAYFHLGRKEACLEWLNKLTAESEVPFIHGQYFMAARVYANMGEVDEAFAWLERSLKRREPDITFLKGDSGFKNIRSDKRWQEMLDRIGFQ